VNRLKKNLRSPSPSAPLSGKQLYPLTKEIRLKIFDPVISNSFPVRYYGISCTNLPDIQLYTPESRLTYGILNVFEVWSPPWVASSLTITRTLRPHTRMPAQADIPPGPFGGFHGTGFFQGSAFFQFAWLFQKDLAWPETGCQLFLFCQGFWTTQGFELCHHVLIGFFHGERFFHLWQHHP